MKNQALVTLVMISIGVTTPNGNPQFEQNYGWLLKPVWNFIELKKRSKLKFWFTFDITPISYCVLCFAKVSGLNEKSKCEVINMNEKIFQWDDPLKKRKSKVDLWESLGL